MVMMMGSRWIFCCLLLLILGRSARLAEDDRHVDRVVFGLEGQRVYFPMPEGDWWARQWTWPKALQFPTKIYMFGEETARTGIVVKDFSHDDEGRKYSVRTNTEVTTHYRAVLANRIEVDVGATLSLQITPEISGEITWKYTSTSTTKCTDFVEVFGHGRFKGRVRVETTGKLRVSDWGWRDDGFFTAVINGKFAANFKVESMVRVKIGDDLHLDPDLVEPIRQFSWYRDSTLVVDYDAAGAGGVVYKLPLCGNCNFDTKTGKLTVKSSQGSYDGVFTMMVNGKLHKNGIKVVGDVIFMSLKQNMQLTPPPFDVPLNSILWRHGGDLAAEYMRASDKTLEYWTICANNNCNLDTTTGILTVATWDPSRGKSFTVEVNDRTQPNKYVVVKNLADCEASVETHAISPTKTKLICVGDFDGAGPVRYSWRLRGTPTWVQGTSVMETNYILVRIGLLASKYDACKIENPVGERVTVLNS